MNFGTEYQASSYSSRNFENDTTKVGTLNFDDILKVQNSTSFASLNLDLDGGWIINTGFSLNFVNYEINRLITNLDDDVPGKIEIDFDPQFVPRLSIAKNYRVLLQRSAELDMGFHHQLLKRFEPMKEA